MEQIQGTHKASLSETEDIISNMPDNMTTKIIDRLGLQNAVRTSILSRKWRFKWTMLTQLVFDEDFFWRLGSDYEDDFGRIINRFLLHINGAITKFNLCIQEQCYSINVEDVSHWILFLSKRGIKDLTICYEKGPRLKLPTHLFSCLQLKHLKLDYCCFDPPATFHGFPNLLSLDLFLVDLESGKFGEFFTQCPALEILKMDYPYVIFDNCFTEVKLVEIAKLANLRILSLFLRVVDDTNSCSICELVGFLPKLQELHLNFCDCNLAEGFAEKRFQITYPYLKVLKLSKIDLSNDIELSYAFNLIRSFPNLHSLEITSCGWVGAPTPEICSPNVIDYSTMGLLQLRRVVLMNLKGSENEVCLIKYLLECSPFLKKIVIHLYFDYYMSLLFNTRKLMFARKLLKLYRASPVVDIDLLV